MCDVHTDENRFSVPVFSEVPYPPAQHISTSFRSIRIRFVYLGGNPFLVPVFSASAEIEHHALRRNGKFPLFISPGNDVERTGDSYYTPCSVITEPFKPLREAGIGYIYSREIYVLSIFDSFESIARYSFIF